MVSTRPLGPTMMPLPSRSAPRVLSERALATAFTLTLITALTACTSFSALESDAGLAGGSPAAATPPDAAIDGDTTTQSTVRIHPAAGLISALIMVKSPWASSRFGCDAGDSAMDRKADR